MSICRCKCGKIFDSDFEMETNDGSCICDQCAEEINFREVIEKIQQIVIEDVPHQYQERILNITKEYL